MLAGCRTTERLGGFGSARHGKISDGSASYRQVKINLLETTRNYSKLLEITRNEVNMWSTVCDLVSLEAVEQTITDAEQGIGISKRYSDIDEMFEDLNKD